MASSDQFAAGAVHSSLSEVVRFLDVELHELLASREEVAKQIRRIRATVSALNKFAARPASNRTVEEKCFAHRRRPESSDPGDVLRLKLRRACRIALLEGDQPLYPQEISERIVRRGSFSFVNADFARSAILRELVSLHQAGEVICLGCGLKSKWQLLRREPDAG